MRALLIPLLAVTAVAAQVPTTPGLRTMRVDYFHTGDAKQEIFSFDEAVIEPAAGPGAPAAKSTSSTTAPTASTCATRRRRRCSYSRGFGSIFDEWSTTDEATKVTRTFHESVRFPMPARAGHRDHPQAHRQRHHLARRVDDHGRSRRTCS